MIPKTVSGPSPKSSQDLAGVQDAVRIERRLDAPHEVDLDRTFDLGEKVTLQPADAVLGRDRPAEFADDRIDDRVHVVPAGKKRLLVHPWRLADVEMDVP